MIAVKQRQGRMEADESLHLSCLKVSSSYIMPSIAPPIDFARIWSNHPSKPGFLTACQSWFLLDGTTSNDGAWREIKGRSQSRRLWMWNVENAPWSYPVFDLQNEKDSWLTLEYATWEAAVPPKKRAHKAPATNKHSRERLSDTRLSVGACGVQPVCHAGAWLFFCVLAHGTSNWDGNQCGTAYVCFFHCSHVGLKAQQDINTYTHLDTHTCLGPLRTM